MRPPLYRLTKMGIRLPNIASRTISLFWFIHEPFEFRAFEYLNLYSPQNRDSFFDAIVKTTFLRGCHFLKVMFL